MFKHGAAEIDESYLCALHSTNSAILKERMQFVKKSFATKRKMQSSPFANQMSQYNQNLRRPYLLAWCPYASIWCCEGNSRHCRAGTTCVAHVRWEMAHCCCHRENHVRFFQAFQKWCMCVSCVQLSRNTSRRNWNIKEYLKLKLIWLKIKHNSLIRGFFFIEHSENFELVRCRSSVFLGVLENFDGDHFSLSDVISRNDSPIWAFAES